MLARQQQQPNFPPVALMNKRQLVAALNFVFLGELKQNLVERLHEFTDCAYTKHEHRETILSLLSCIKFILNKFVKLIYRLRRRVASPSEPNQLGNLRQFSRQLVDSCSQLNYELQTAAIELADELDRLNGELELTKQMKHHCLVGDIAKARLVFGQFCEQSEQLVETCRMLNQIAPTNKLKIMSKSLACWFQLNYSQVVAFAGCLSENPTSKTAKDCVWTYIQVWSSFYDDFCQLARQLTYLAHSKCDPSRAGRVARLREQIGSARTSNMMRPLLHEEQERRHQIMMAGGGELFETNCSERRPSQEELERLEDECEAATRSGSWFRKALHSIGSFQSLSHNQQFAFEMAGQAAANNSPRSLDHYHGFGPNYRLWHEAHGQNHCNSSGRGSSGAVATVDEIWLQSHASSLMLSPSPKFASDNPFGGDAGGEPSTLLDYSSIRRQQVASCDSSLSSLAAAERQYLMGMVTPASSQGGCSQQPQHNWSHEGNDGASKLSSRVCSITPSYMPIGGSVGSTTPLAPTLIRVDPHAPPIEPPSVPARRPVATLAGSGSRDPPTQQELCPSQRSLALERVTGEERRRRQRPSGGVQAASRRTARPESRTPTLRPEDRVREEVEEEEAEEAAGQESAREARLERTNGDQHSIASSTLDGTQTTDKWSDSEADAIVRGARETAQMALSMYQFTRGEGDLNTTQDLFTQAELFAEEANELYKEVRCFSYKVPAGDLKKDLLFQLSTIPALVQQLQFTVKNPTVGKAATFAKVDSVIRETKFLMEAVNRVVEATLSCRQHYNMASASLRKRTRTLSPTYRGDKFEFEPFGSPGGGRGLGGAFGGSGSGGRHAPNASGGMGSEPDI